MPGETSLSLERRALLKTIAASGLAFNAFSAYGASEAGQTGGSPFRRRFVPTAFGEVFCWQTGRGPDLLLIHQSGQTSQEYLSTAPYLSQHFRVTGIDLPGHGQSDTPGRELTFQEYSDALVAVLDALAVLTTHIVGHHGGGGLAIDLATRYADRCNKLVLSGVGRDENVDFEKLMNTPLTRDLPIDAQGLFLEKTWQVYRKMSARNTPPAITFQPFLVSLQQRQRPYDMHRAAYRWDYIPVLPQLDKPVLLLKAEEDIYAGDTRALQQKVKNSEFVSISGCGAWQYYERPGKCAEVISSFLLK